MNDEFPKRTTINCHSIKVVGRYCETDQGGVIHHSVFPIWFEMGRTELLRANGMAYKDLEKSGVFFVIAELNVKYRRPALYDENLMLETTCINVTAARINHAYKLTRENGLILAEGSTVLACIDNVGKPRRIPSFFLPETDL